MINWVEDTVSFLPNQQIFILILKQLDQILYEAKFSNRCLTDCDGTFVADADLKSELWNSLRWYFQEILRRVIFDKIEKKIPRLSVVTQESQLCDFCKSGHRKKVLENFPKFIS